jgi:hypothetical protein
MFKLLEKKIRGLLMQIESGKTTPEESGIADLLNRMKEIDEPCWEGLAQRYIKALGKIEAAEVKQTA